MSSESKIHKSSENLHALGSGSTKYDYGLEPGWKVREPSASVLEKFRAPGADEEDGGRIGQMSIPIEIPEFTCLCPKTGQPDFAIMKVVYVPDKWCVESKSLKLYLMQYRMYGIFHEEFCRRFANDLISLLDPHALQIQTNFYSRGGLSFTPIHNYQRPRTIQAVPPGSAVRQPGPGTRIHR